MLIVDFHVGDPEEELFVSAGLHQIEHPVNGRSDQALIIGSAKHSVRFSCKTNDIIFSTVGIRLPANQLPETSSYWNFSSSLTEWSLEKADHSVNKLFVRYSGHHSVTGLKVR